jgi:hypothetical protein
MLNISFVLFAIFAKHLSLRLIHLQGLRATYTKYEHAETRKFIPVNYVHYYYYYYYYYYYSELNQN